MADDCRIDERGADVGYSGSSAHGVADELLALRARVAKLEAALKFYAEDCGSYARAALSQAPDAAQ